MVLKNEKNGKGAIPKRKKNFSKDSGIVRKFEMNGEIPTKSFSLEVNIPPMAFDRK